MGADFSPQQAPKLASRIISVQLTMGQPLELRWAKTSSGVAQSAHPSASRFSRTEQAVVLFVVGVLQKHLVYGKNIKEIMLEAIR